MEGEVAFEADALYQNAGEKSRPHTQEADPPRRRGKPRRRGNKIRGLGNWETDRVPLFGVKGPTSAELRYFVRPHADAATCRDSIESTTPVGAPLSTEGLTGYVWVGQGHCSVHGPVFHSK